MRRLTQAGDTIVEVLICLAIIGSVLAAAYAIATRNLAGDQSSQERSEAVSIAQSQIEGMRGLDTSLVKPGGGQAFCMTSTNTEVPAWGPPPAIASSDTLIGYPGGCVSGLFHIFITYGGAPDDTYTVHVRWNAINSNNINEVLQYYRWHI